LTVNVSQLFRTLSSQDQTLVQPNVLLQNLTTLHIGGPAALVCPVHNPEQARRFHALARDRDIPLFVLGGGSNVLAADEGFQGIILQIAAQEIERRGDVVHVDAGLNLDRLIAKTLAWGLTGLEFASGIPGTVGGALIGNAGCYGHEISDFLLEAVVLRPDGHLETIGPEAFGFRYRGTDLRETGNVILTATLRLTCGDVAAAMASRTEKMADRRRKHPVDLPSAGSWFRNLPPLHPGARRQAAGQLLEQAGALHFRQGDAHVYAKHANMIVNAGQATSDDVLTLAARMRQAVQDRFGLTLEAEVRLLSDSSVT